MDSPKAWEGHPCSNAMMLLAFATKVSVWEK
jgi:hypothetical protein